jgi:hypothetical protein
MPRYSASTVGFGSSYPFGFHVGLYRSSTRYVQSSAAAISACLKHYYATPPNI